MAEKITDNLFLIDTIMVNRKKYTSVYLLRTESGAVVFDSAVSTTVGNIIEGIFTAGVDPQEVKYLCLSHAHYDHAGGASQLIEVLHESGNSEVKAVCSKTASIYLGREDILEKLLLAGKNGEGVLSGKMDPIAEKDFRIIEDNDVIDLGDVKINCIDTPGHAKGHIAFHIPAQDFIFTGDCCGLLCREKDGTCVAVPTMFNPEYTHDVYINTVRKIIDLNVGKVGFAHFGLPDDPSAVLSKSIELAEEIRSIVKDHFDERISEEECMKILEDLVGEVMLSLYHTQKRVRFDLKCFIDANMTDLKRG
jgi:glyoxylase-like metal-dependent hydrolase (beta-lactamase superfamily II)